MARKVRVTAAEGYTRWKDNLSAATQQITNGVNAVEQSPTALAAAKQAKMRAGIIEAIDSGKWAAALKAVSLEQWKTKMLNVGIPRIAQGADNAQAKVEKFFNELYAFEDNLLAKINAMSDTTLNDRINKMVAWATGMSKFKKTS